MSKIDTRTDIDRWKVENFIPVLKLYNKTNHGLILED